LAQQLAGPTALTSKQAAVLDAVAELIIPATETPGARAAGVPAFVERALATYCEAEQAEAIREGLTSLDRDANEAHGKPFASISEAQQVALLSPLDIAAANTAAPSQHFFRALKELVTIGYFTSEPGATLAVRYDPVPGQYRGCVPLSQIGRGWAI